MNRPDVGGLCEDGSLAQVAFPATMESLTLSTPDSFP